MRPVWRFLGFGLLAGAAGAAFGSASTASALVLTGGLATVSLVEGVAIRNQVGTRGRLERQNDLFERAQEIADVGAWEYDVVSEELFWTRQVKEIFSLPQSYEPTVEEAVSFYHPEDRSFARDMFWGAVEEGSPFDEELRIVNGEEGPRWVRVQGTPRVEEGEVSRVRGTFQDITELKENQLRREAAFENTYQLTGLVKPDGTLLKANETALSFVGASREEVTGKPLWETPWFQAGEETVDIARQSVEEARGGGFYRQELPIKGRDGKISIFDYSMRPVQDETGEVAFLVPEGRDITQRKRREQMLKSRRRKIEALYRATSGLLSVGTRDAVPGRIAEVLQEVFGFPLRHVGLVEGEMLVPKETVGEDLSRMPEPKAQPLSEDLVATRAIEAGEAVVVESTGGLENDLDYGTLSTLAGIPIGGHGAVVVGKEVGTFDALDLRLLEVLGGYGTLVLGRLEREKRLVQAREEAEEAAQLKSAMLANMSHEVRTPLMSMIGSADLLREDLREVDLEEAGLEGEPADMAEQIFRSGQRLRETLDSVLELSRLESGAYTLDDDSTYLDVVVREVAQELNLRAQEKGVRLEVGSPGASVEAGLDETAVRRIVRNLVENAIKFTPEGGEVQVRVEPEDEETALLAVEDTGVGIAEEAREDIFDAFKQESEGLGREYEGSGLGLSIVDRLTTMVGGTIEVESEKGAGTRFAVRLPR
ncbi:PAS domain-containing sensor histidine kinase [Salinibacter ruber]|uniref:PAS domain-containing sensor histidine kinase n=2 Tax=Salinibacter ruber TaxID=146919 RepID=UPI002166CB81|nr:ATP-binding protein [Salinibacter ruber]MCS3648226.1 PAS domain S-box-containing protein [Salinibacter ruber]